MKLIVQRHADAGEHVEDPKKDDARPLSALGKKVAAAVAKDFADTNPKPSVIYTSELPRAKETAEFLADALGGADVQVVKEIHPHGDVKAFVQKMAKDESVTRLAIVGHSDNLQPLLAELGDTEAFAKGEIRRYRIKRDMSGLKERDRIMPSDVSDDFEDDY